jgi:predicted ribosomally synthesized peptide with nif11-like leader
MSAESAQALVERLTTDADFRAKVEAAGSPEEARSVVQAEGFDVSQQDVEEMQQGSQKVLGPIGDALDAIFGL